jgi:hemolysin activation/secretion protein
MNRMSGAPNKISRIAFCSVSRLLALAICAVSTAWALAPALASEAAPAAAPAAGASVPAPAAQVQSPTFDVMNYVVEGNSLLSDEAVENAVTPYLGPDKTFKDIEAARAALEKAYQDAGFLSVVVSLPPQRVDGGDIRLQVVEAPVEKLRITGSQYHLPSKLR